MFAIGAIVVVTLLSAFGSANAGGPPTPTAPVLALAAGSPSESGSSAAASAAPGDNGPGPTQPLLDPTSAPAPTPRPTDSSGIPLPTPTPTPSSSPTTEPGMTSLEPEQLTGYKWPLRGARVSSFFQDRSDGFLVVDGQRIHEGLDLATFCGDKIHAAHSGVVLAVGRRFDPVMGFNGPLGDFYAKINRQHSLFELPIVVVVDDGNGYRSAYVHLGLASVKVGQVLKVGDLIGYEGRTGHATGCHLHYELFRMDGPWMEVAPDLVKSAHYPTAERERIDPFRVLSMKQPGHPRFIPGIDPPAISPGLGRPTVWRTHSALPLVCGRWGRVRWWRAPIGIDRAPRRSAFV